MYELKLNKSQSIVGYAFGVFFILLGICMAGFINLGPVFTNPTVPGGLFFIFCGIVWDVRIAAIARNFIRFDPAEPELIIKNGFRRPVSILPVDCIKLTKTSGYTTIEKLVYKVGGRTRKIVLYNSVFETDKAWKRYSRKWLESIKTDRIKSDDTQFQNILDNPTEKYYEEHNGTKNS